MFELESRTLNPPGDGAWGIRVPVVHDAPQLLSHAPAGWPQVLVHASVSADLSRAVEWGPNRAQYTLLGGHHIRIEREPLSVTLDLCRPTPPEGVVTPHLSSAASTIAIWGGDEPFHAGAFLHRGGAWGVLGTKGSGKTSTLAVLNDLGVPVLTDDLLIYRRGEALAGPRCIDLRRGPAQRLAQGTDIGIIGTRRRWRVYLPPCPLSAPLRGWLVPEWGDSDRVDPVEPAERLRLLPAFRALRVPWENAQSLLEVATLPVLRWQRPRRLELIKSSVHRLLDRLDAAT
jgi:hypothetical protein